MHPRFAGTAGLAAQGFPRPAQRGRHAAGRLTRGIGLDVLGVAARSTPAAVGGHAGGLAGHGGRREDPDGADRDAPARLDDGRTERSCIQTEAGRGYRFVAPVARKQRDELSPASQAAPISPDATLLPAADAPPSRATGAWRYRLTAVLAAACNAGSRGDADRWRGSAGGSGQARHHRSVSQSSCCRSRTWMMTPRTTIWRTRSPTS